MSDEAAAAAPPAEGGGGKKKGKGGDDELPADQRVRVAVRVRPFNKADHNIHKTCLTIDGNSITADNEQRVSTFNYDHVFQGSQEEVFAAIGETMLQDAFSGFNATIFAYGQTGSGKTYSMLGVEGDPVHEGLLPRICRMLFELTEELQAEDPSLLIKTQVSFVEVYNEKIRDLLEYEGTGLTPPTDASQLRELKLKEDKKMKCFYVDQLSMHTVMNYARVRKLIDEGSHLRTHALTGMNDISSRSHSVFTIYLSQVHEPPNAMDRDRASKITIVDLAGSERQSKTDVGIGDPTRLKEAERINMSLLILGRCLNACTDHKGKTHIPIRDSVLTKMLSDIFGGNSKAMMFAAVSPSIFNYGETLSTLQYAFNAKKIKHKAKVNNLSKQIEIAELKEQVKALGKTLIEELEKAAKTKEALDAEIAGINEEKELIAAALKVCQQENELLKQQIETIRQDIAQMKAGVADGTYVPGEGGGEVGEGGEEGEEGEYYDEEEGDYEDEEEEGGGGEDGMSPDTKLAQLRAELTRKLSNLSGPPSARGRGPPGFDAMFNRGSSDGASDAGSSVSSSGGMRSNEIRQYTGHGAAVYALAFSPNGEFFVSASRDRTLKVWDVKGGGEVGVLKGHSGYVLTCAYSPNGKHIISGADDKNCKIWDATSFKKVVTLKGHADKVYSVAYSPRGDVVASASCDKSIRIWNADSSGKCQIVLKDRHTSAVFAVSFSPDGNHICSASDDKTIRIFDWKSGQQLKTFEGHTGTVWSCRYNPSGTQIVSASMDGTCMLWDVATGQASASLRGHSAPVHHAIYAKDGHRVVTASRDRTLKVWDVQSGRVLSTMIGHQNTVYYCCAFNDLVLSCSSDETIRAWNLKA